MHREAGQERICHRGARRVLNPSVILFVAESRPSGNSREKGDLRMSNRISGDCGRQTVGRKLGQLFLRARCRQCEETRAIQDQRRCSDSQSDWHSILGRHRGMEWSSSVVATRTSTPSMRGRATRNGHAQIMVRGNLYALMGKPGKRIAAVPRFDILACQS
jgi:hypothetical protein